MKLHSGPATLVFRSCVFGIARIDVRQFRVTTIESSNKNDKAVRVDYIKPGQKAAFGATFTPDSHRFLVIEQDDATVLYDSRNDVPIDMRAYEAQCAKFMVHG